MLPDPNIHEELLTLSPALAAIPRVQVFSVPDGYFDTLSADILLNIHDSKNLARPSVPQGYFENLPQLILNRVKQEEIMAESETGSVLSGISRHNVFTVPDGYFDSLTESILQQVPRPAKVVGLNHSMSFFRYAIAACITGILGLGLFSAFNNGDDEPVFSPVIVAEANQILKNNTYDQMLNAITDEEITQYLNASGQDVNTALMASMTEESNLPEADEYIFDEQTLEKMMTDLRIPQNTNN